MSFAYHANALAIGGRLEQPACEVIPSQASVSLSPSGGEGYSTVRNYDYKGMLTFDEASVYVAGSQHGKERNTLATVTIKNLNVFNMVHAELLVARVSSRHDEGEEEGQITFAGTTIKNLTVAGRRVEPVLDTDLFARYPTHEKWLREAPSDREYGELPQRFGWDDKMMKAANDPCGIVHASLVRDVIGLPHHDGKSVMRGQQLSRSGYIVAVEEFGTIHLAELVMKKGQRRLNLLRLTLGCPVVGHITAGCVEGNGTDIMP